MSESDTSFPKKPHLRHAAEALLTGNVPTSQAESKNPELEEMQALLHELQVYQIELEMQNEELRQAQAALEISRDRYFDLYELAPVGYVTIDTNGQILEANLVLEKLLGLPRKALVQMPFGRFVAKESQNSLYLHRKKLTNLGDTDGCDVEMLRDDGSRFWAHLQCTISQAHDGSLICRCVLDDISERKQAECATQASEIFTKNLIHSMQDGFSVCDDKGVALIVNPAFCQITGYSEEELLGKGPPHPYWPPEELPRISAAMQQALGSTTSNFELVFIRKNGQRFPVIVSAYEIRNEITGSVNFAATLKDITLLKQAEVALREWNQTLERRVGERTLELQRSEDRFRQLAESTFEGIAISENGVIVDGNPQFAAMHRYEMREMIGRPISDFVAPESQSLVASQIRNGIEKPYECMGLRKDGTKFPLEACGRMMTWQGNVSRVTALRDLTAAKQVEAELDQALNLALVSEISAGIIHQIGQPLSAIGAYSAAAATKLNSSQCDICDCLDVFKKIDTDIARMRESVSHLRALANIQKPYFVRIDFNAMVQDSLLAVKSEAAMKQITIEMDLDAGQPHMSADAVQLRQVLINLLQNAIDASVDLPQERLCIQITTRVLSTNKLELCIRDHGAGISPKASEHLFSPFFTTKNKGFGIGLRLSHTIIKAHHGTITGFNNPDGIGATFRVILPLGTP